MEDGKRWIYYKGRRILIKDKQPKIQEAEHKFGDYNYCGLAIMDDKGEPI